MNSRFAPCVVLAWCLFFWCQFAICVGGDSAAGQPLPVEPLSRGRAAQIIGNTETIVASLNQQMTQTRDALQGAIFDDVRDVMAHASEWRWYSRDHGILLAIPVRERLGISAKVSGEKMLADVVRRLVYQQGWGNPAVQVVFIEPELPCPPPCGCRAREASDEMVGHAACGCR